MTGSLHTAECLEYARSTKRAFCIVQCRDARREREQRELEEAVRGAVARRVEPVPERVFWQHRAAAVARAAAIEVLPPLAPLRCTVDDDHTTHDPVDGPVLVRIDYFKPQSGKWYTEDQDVLWSPDAEHYTRWQPFSTLVRLKEMWAVCMATPLGYPIACPPSRSP